MEPIEKFAKLFKDRDNKEYFADTTTGTIVSPPPNLVVNIFGNNVSKNLGVAQHLLKGYQRECVVDSIELSYDYDENNSTSTEVGGSPPHTHAINTLSGNGELSGSGRMKFTYETEEPLKVGDVVMVQLDSQNKRFYILDKIIFFGGD